MSMPITSARAALAAVVAGALVVAGAPLVAHAATTLVVDFTAAGYSTGALKPAGQNGWWQAKAADFSLVDNDSLPAAGLPAGGRSLQFSNATIPSGGAHLVSPLVDPAGEPSTGAAANTFTTEFTVASATGSLQPGLGVDVAIDGASRYGGVVNLRHTAEGLAIGSYWVPEDAIGVANSDWRSATFVTVPADAPHVIRIEAVFLEDRPDSVQVFVDGTLVSAGSGVTTWEFYTTLAGGGGDRSVDSLSFKSSASAPTADGIGYVAGLPPVPATAGLGFLFTGISYGVSTGAPPLPTDPPALDPAPEPSPDGEAEFVDHRATDGTIEFEAGGYLPYENVFATIYSAPIFAGWFQADEFGVVSGSVTIPSDLAAGTHTLQLTGETSGWVTSAAFAVAALAATGVETGGLILLAGLLVLAGVGAIGGVRLTRRAG